MKALERARGSREAPHPPGEHDVAAGAGPSPLAPLALAERQVEGAGLQTYSSCLVHPDPAETFTDGAVLAPGSTSQNKYSLRSCSLVTSISRSRNFAFPDWAQLPSKSWAPCLARPSA